MKLCRKTILLFLCVCLICMPLCSCKGKYTDIYGPAVEKIIERYISYEQFFLRKGIMIKLDTTEQSEPYKDQEPETALVLICASGVSYRFDKTGMCEVILEREVEHVNYRFSFCIRFVDEKNTIIRASSWTKNKTNLFYNGYCYYKNGKFKKPVDDSEKRTSADVITADNYVKAAFTGTELIALYKEAMKNYDAILEISRQPI